MNQLRKIIKDRSISNIKGVYSACTANPLVIKACIVKAKQTDTPLIIEATANQVNQYGGYTGMRPIDFRNLVKSLCDELDYNFEKVILGGDHLGPLTFAHYDEEKVMCESKELIRQYVLAGFTKIHVDTSMKISSDSIDHPLAVEIVARRAMVLIEEALNAYEELKKGDPNAIRPCFVVGSEVPIPGGEQGNVDSLQVTKVSDFKHQISIFQEVLTQSLWNDVVAIVVQPGVEFGDNIVFHYDSDKAYDLISAKKRYSNIVFEGHSTDYQTKENLRKMVDDDIAVLKVGPALTFKYRQALFALDQIEQEMMLPKPSNLRHIIEKVMCKNQKYWENYYFGDEKDKKIKRAYSYSDRVRYYLPCKEVELAIERLRLNINNNEILMPVLYQWLPMQYNKILRNEIGCNFDEIVFDCIGEIIDDYIYAIKR